MEIDDKLYERLKYLGVIPDETRSANVGNSNYAQRTIQPWSVWLDWELNAWDADIVKRIGRIKVDAGYTPDEQRILDYQKIKHICDERIRQIRALQK